MKVKITTTTIDKKTQKVLPVKHSADNNYKVLSITLKEKNVTKTVFI
mgnify:CR=1|tara:strand:+ start:547 stop:687 length:141 start_codon:yes stop_codon:yes gene_type:complete